MNWLILLYFLELGYSPFYESLNSISEEYSYIKNESVFYITLDAEIILFDYLFIGGAVKTYFQDKINEKSYIPFESDYLFKAGLRYKNLEVGFRHFCLHPVRPYEMYYQPQGSTDASYEEFYIRISSEF
jgi:hypothetical protein